MKKQFFILFILICVCCFGLALGILHLVPDKKQSEELIIYRNGKQVKDSLSVLDEELAHEALKEQPDIEIMIDSTKTDTAKEQSYSWYSTTVYVEDLIPNTEYVVVLEYLNLESVILEALLYEPDFISSYSKETFSSDGRIVFPLSQGKEGTYTIAIYGTGDIGGFTTYIIRREDFMNVQKPNIEYPRDLMREDAVIDE